MSVPTDSSPAPARSVPPLFARLVDEDARFPAGGISLAEAVAGHRAHRAAWYADLVGPLLVPASVLGRLPGLLGAGERLAVGVVADTGPDGLAPAVEAAAGRLDIVQVELAVAKRGEDPLPGLRRFLTVVESLGVTGYAEIPLTWGLLSALDTLAEVLTSRLPVAAKFRTGGLAAELFPTPVELAAVICACRDRRLPFKLTSSLQHAIRYTDPETGFVHHGFLNVLVAAALADGGAEVAEVAEVLAATGPAPLVEPAHDRRDQQRPLWRSFGSCSVTGPLTDLRHLDLIDSDLGSDPGGGEARSAAEPA